MTKSKKHIEYLEKELGIYKKLYSDCCKKLSDTNDHVDALRIKIDDLGAIRNDNKKLAHELESLKEKSKIMACDYARLKQRVASVNQYICDNMLEHNTHAPRLIELHDNKIGV